MKKFVISLLICLCFLLCSCSADTSGYQNELTCTDWSAELDGGGKISLSFDGGNASLYYDERKRQGGALRKICCR